VSGEAVPRRNQVVTVAMVFAVFTGFAFVLPFLPLYVQALGVREPETAALWAGVLIGISPLLAGVLAPIWGRLADRHGHKRVAATALVAYVVLLALCATVSRVEELLVLRVGIGIFGALGPLGLAMAAAQAPREETGRAVGLVQAAQILAAAVGPFAGGVLADTIGMRPTFLAAAGLCALALLLLLALYRETGSPPAGSRADAGAGFRGVIVLPGVLGLLTVLFVVNFVGRSFLPILPLHLQVLGVPPVRLSSATGVLISVYSVAAAASATLLGRASRTRSPRTLLGLSLLGGAPIVMAMALVPSYSAFLGLALLGGLVSGGALTLCYTIGGLMVPPGVRTTAFGFFAGAALFGGAVAPTCAGLVAQGWLRGIYWVDGGLYLVLAAFARGRSPRPVEEPPPGSPA
jgi:DHA1 family multidrug resistance protein-like MFS transporter